MSHWFFEHLPLALQKKEGLKKAFTMVELLITMAIVGTLAAIGMPMWTSYKTQQNNAVATAGIRDIESQIEGFCAVNGYLPATLAAANIVPPNDPWGNAYIYVCCPGNRWDKHIKPLNKDYDLLSMGKDGKTDTKIWKSAAADDIIRGNTGAYIGLASQY